MRNLIILLCLMCAGVVYGFSTVGLDADSKIVFWGDSWTSNGEYPTVSGQPFIKLHDSLYYHNRAHWAWRLCDDVGWRNWAVVAKGGAGMTRQTSTWRCIQDQGNIKYIQDYDPDLVFFLGGVNDYELEWDADTTIHELYHVIDTLRTVLPNAKLVVQTLHCGEQATARQEGRVVHRQGRDVINAWLRGDTTVVVGVGNSDTLIVPTFDDNFIVYDAARWMEDTLGTYDADANIDSCRIKPVFDNDSLHLNRVGQMARGDSLWAYVLDSLQFDCPHRNLYVDWDDPSAYNWGNSGTDPSRPFKTLACAIDRAFDGDTIVVMNDTLGQGFYDEGFTSQEGFFTPYKPYADYVTIKYGGDLDYGQWTGEYLIAGTTTKRSWYVAASKVVPGYPTKFRLDGWYIHNDFYRCFDAYTPIDLQFVNCGFEDQDDGKSLFTAHYDSTIFNTEYDNCVFDGLLCHVGEFSGAELNLAFSDCTMRDTNATHNDDDSCFVLTSAQGDISFTDCDLGVCSTLRCVPGNGDSCNVAFSGCSADYLEGEDYIYTQAVGTGYIGTFAIENCTFKLRNTSKEGFYLRGSALTTLTSSRFIACDTLSRAMVYIYDFDSTAYIYNNLFYSEYPTNTLDSDRAHDGLIFCKSFNRLYNNVFMLDGYGSILSMYVSDPSETANDIRSNAWYSTNDPDSIFCLNGNGAYSFAEWLAFDSVGVDYWIGHMDTTVFYTSDTCKFGGDHADSPLSLPHTFSSIGPLAPHLKPPRVGTGYDYATLQAADALVISLNWTIDDTVDFDIEDEADVWELAGYASDSDSLTVNPTLIKNPWRGHWE